MKKKLLAVVLCGAMALSMLAGCGGKKEEAPAADATAEAEAGDVADAAEATGDLSDANIAVFYYTYSDTYISSVRTALDAKLDSLGVKYQNYDANNNQTTQNEQIDTALAQGANILIVNIVTSGSVDASQAVVDKASAKGVDLIFFNRAVEDDATAGQVLGSYDKCAFVGTDAPEAGHMQGKMIGDYLVENFDKVDLNGDGKISYAMVTQRLFTVLSSQ